MKPTNGRIVHFLQGGYHYAAIVVRVVTDTNKVTLKVFGCGSQGPNPVPGALDSDGFAYQVPFDEHAQRDWTWHWPERE